MNQIPKLKDFEAPEGYFEQLPDQIIDQLKPAKSFSWIKYAAAAVLLGLGITWQLDVFQAEPEPLTLEEEVNLYIDSHTWTDEDVLSLAENPDAVLDEILSEELPAEEDLWNEDEQNWF
ncbi:hypothetical protein D0X99_18005 [Algoriphagus lacus]|uniref:Uncharacterized protein n=1 Tax=Algoriphagus lacus TaxID=2056311 RepID=A0A418PM46_9BACT|nr:hypothetical protein [Algoriphagus lacus]RIW12694.1 hypothetical protein D0X99_18005 [Algoriphagus lacus]